ncbi:MAG TPA: hypothetical protein PLH80_08695 [Spirochaetota bacterium]|nr:hypothetical protein [Spirochaetota bacterium]HOM86401.1 hypothetical protein [Spirochaetota bacterium]HOR94150.1 hypothetical protein [Spirochaetota bacterium]HOT18404.1 hypothetical protein [Spirochaetota bacterium]HPD05214.1 hypothetical protein [Spirochaetota bacterium]
MNKQVSLCQPGNGKGCCVCCGLFNLRNVSHNVLSQFLTEASIEVSYGKIINNLQLRKYGSIKKIYDFRDSTTYVCPFMGFIFNNTPGCLVHPSINDGIDSRDHSLFGKELCNDYFCPAYRILSDREKKILIRCTCDWYSYSIGIMDPLSFRWIIQQVEGILDIQIVPEIEQENAIVRCVNEALSMLGMVLNTLDAPLFYYSEPEYYLHMRIVSLNSESMLNKNVREAIQRLIINNTRY